LISRKTIDQVFSAVRLEEVIGEYLQLKRAGSNFKGLSPFVDEKSPSFIVSPAKQIWKDFSSGKGGTVISFLMEIEKFSYPDAIRHLAKKYGIPIEEDAFDSSPEAQQAKSERDKLYKIHEVANQFFQDQLWESTEGQNIGLSYFKERGLSQEIIRKFQLGYSPEKKDSFALYAQEKGYENELLHQSGICFLVENTGQCIDRFRERIIFPIFSFSGRVLGFGARILKNNVKTAKYLNSPETEIYHKSDVLYGLNQSKQAISKENNCFLVEGYMDVIAMHQAGVENVVASSGTALTTAQIKLIKRLSPNVSLLFDGDAAGIKASFRSIDLLLAQDMNVKVVLFPEGHDPDSFSRTLSTEDFKAFLSREAKDFISFKAEILQKDAQNDPVKRADLLKEVVKSIAYVSNPLQQEIFVQATAQQLGVSERNLFQELETQKMLLQKEQQQGKNTQGFAGSQAQNQPNNQDYPAQNQPNPSPNQPAPLSKSSDYSTVDPLVIQEEALFNLGMKYGDVLVDLHQFLPPVAEAEGQEKPLEITVAQALVAHFEQEDLLPLQAYHQEILQEIKDGLQAGEIRTGQFFLSLMNEDITQMTVNALLDGYQTSEKWKDRGIYFNLETDVIDKIVFDNLLRHKREYINHLITLDKKSLLQEISDETRMAIYHRITQLLKVKSQIDLIFRRVL
jgi:DNA primase